MRPNRTAPAFAFALSLLAAPAIAQTAPAPATAPPPAAAPGDPVVARVNGNPIHMSDITDAAQSLPQEYRGMPQEQLVPMLLDQLVDRAAVAALARKEGLENDPEVKAAIAHATEDALENAVMRRDIEPTITDAALHALYDSTVAGKSGEEEVHASHILLATEAEALKVIADLKGGADFATLAKAKSSDPGAAQGGDLGFFKKADMVPEFAEAAFAMKVGEISDKPVKSQFGWHVIKIEERRAAPAPTFDQASEQLRQKIIHAGVLKVLTDARKDATIERFNLDGTPRKATDSATPPANPHKP